MLVGYPKIIPIPSLNTISLWDHSFWGYAPDISVKNALIDPVNLTCDLSITKPEHFWVRYSKVIAYSLPSLNTLESFVF